MHADTEEHRLSAFIDGFLSGLGLILIMWGLASIATIPSGSVAVSMGMVLLGVCTFVVGGFREAYTWGSLLTSSNIAPKPQPNQDLHTAPPKEAEKHIQTQPQATYQGKADWDSVTTEQIAEYPTETANPPTYPEEEQV